MKVLSVAVTTPYSIYITDRLIYTKTFTDYCKQIKKKLVIITDSNLKDSLGKTLQSVLYKQSLNVDLISFEAGEKHKTRESKQILEDILLTKQYGRDTCFIALGGGVVTDLVGFLASTYCRGVPTIYIPTTLLGMVDASIGGKTGVNTPYGKNLIGSFYQPQAVFMDTAMLNDLPNKEWQNGMVEIIKHSLICDANLFAELKNNQKKIEQRNTDFLTNIIYTSCSIKKKIIEQDEKDCDIRQLLNFGHTIGHAIEAVENYQISHGEAVAIGILVESYISVLSNLLSEDALQEIWNLLLAYHLPLQTSAFNQPKNFKQALLLDKKTIAEKPHFVLLDTIGKAHYENHKYSSSISQQILEQALIWGAKHFGVRKE